MTSKLTQVQRLYDETVSAHRAQNFGMVCDAFIEAITTDADIGFRYFITRASNTIATALRHTRRAPEIVAILDTQLADHPDMHLLVDYAPELIRRIVELRASNIAKGLPSIVVVTQPKSASIPIANIFTSGFNLPSFAYSLVNIEVIRSWATDYAQGGACYVTHLEPSWQNIQRLEQAGIDKVIVHVRDPRQSLLSAIHHVSRYEENRPALLRDDFSQWSTSAQISELLEIYVRRIRWLQDWLDAETRLRIMFSTFEDFARDRAAFVERYIDFYGVSRVHFSMEDVARSEMQVDQHYRAGRIDEWRSIFPPREATWLSACLPAAMKERFGWPD